MKKEIAEAIGILRHQIISPVLMETGRSQMKYFNSIAVQEFDVPGKGKRKFKSTTMKGWLNRYRKHGFKGITPKVRSDVNSHRKIDIELKNKLIELRKNNESISVALYYKTCIEQNILGSPPICLATIRRFLKMNNLNNTGMIEARKRYEMGIFGELFVGDYMHGPLVQFGKIRKKAILLAIIDDHSRMIVGHRFGFHENSIALEEVFKQAILTYGIPDRLYLDNGPSFSSHYLARVCAHLNVGLVHSRPYDSPSRGKIERFFRTVRDQFLAVIRPDEELTIDMLNERFKIWLRDSYHRNIHSGIKTRPIDRYNCSISRFPRKMIDPAILEEFFMVVQTRNVKKDATISYEGRIYEVPANYIGQEVEIRHSQKSDEMDLEIFLYDNDQRICRINLVDTLENGKVFRPSKVPQLSLAKENQP